MKQCTQRNIKFLQRGAFVIALYRMVSKKSLYFSALIFFVRLVVSDVCAQVTLKGKVVDGQSREAVIGAAVVVKGTSKGAATDAEGRFTIQVTRVPVILTVSSIGYKKADYEVKNSDQKIEISLTPDNVFLESIDIEDSRITQKQQEQPLTVESLDLIAIKETPAGNFYDGLGNMKGVDITAASLGFKVINARGFNSTSPVRSLQLIDGVDNQSPGLNFSLGNFLGASELDVKKVELIQGASSSYFGPNAFNGVILMETKSPFEFPGLSALVKVGERALFEGALRWAHKFQNKEGRDVFAYKVNAYYMRARDWEATNYAPATESKAGADNPGGYDAVNRYGDEYLGGKNDWISDTSEFKMYPGLGIVYRDGYREVDLIDYKVENIKTNISLHGMLTPKIEWIGASNFSFGSTVYQGENRFRLKDVQFYQHRLELRQKDKWFLRAYTTHEDAGKSYDAVVTAFLLQNNSKANNKWFNDYSNYYQINFALPGQDVWQLPGFPSPSFVNNPAFVDSALKVLSQYKDSLIQWHQMARAYANSNQGLAGGVGIYPYFPAGSMEFDTAFAGITSRPLGQGGARFFDRSALFHVHGEYQFKIGTLLSLTTGANFRLYAPNSRGTIFADTNSRMIRNYEGGLYAGVEARLGKVKLNMAHRLDKNVNFPLLWSPALSAVFTPRKEHTLRLSLSSAIRNPTLADQYLYYNVGRAILLGNLKGFRNLITIPSFVDYFDHLDTSRLEFMVINPVRPERVWTAELGYRGTLFKKLYVDFSGYYSIYQNFIGFKLGVDAKFVPNNPFPVAFQAYRVSANSADIVHTRGASIQINYYFKKYYAVNGNFTYNELDRRGSTDPLIPAFNTPRFKFNIGVSGRDIRMKIGKARLNNWGFNVNYRWLEGFLFEGSPQFTGRIDSYGMLDAQLNYTYPKAHTTLKIGATNLLNNQVYQVYGGPLIGRLAYLQLQFDMGTWGISKKK